MSDSKKGSLKSALIATICKHPKAEDYQKDAFRKADIKGLYKKIKDAGEVITKSDFLCEDENGVSFLASERAWDNFHLIVDIIRENGEEFTAKDLVMLSDDSYYRRPLIESMSDHKKLDTVFHEHVWQGRFEEMEDLWYYLPPAKRREMTGEESGAIPLDLKKRVLGISKDTEIREETLKNIGVDYKRIPDLFAKSGVFEAFLQNMYEKKTMLKTEDVLFVNHEGDTMFHHVSSWNSYEKIVDILHESGQPWGVKEITFKRGRKPSVLDRAVQHNMLDQVFKPRFWVGREKEMLSVWDSLLPAQKVIKNKSFDNIVADVVNMTYGSRVSLHAENVTVDTLLSPVIANDNEDNAFDVAPIGLRETWNYMDVLREGLQKKGEDISIDMLREKSGVLQTPIMNIAAESNNFDKVISIVRSSEDNLQVQDFLEKNKNDVSLLDVLIDNKQLDAAFSPEIWAGRLQEMNVLWNNVSDRDRKQVDFSKVVSRVNRATLRSKGRGPKRKL